MIKFIFGLVVLSPIGVLSGILGLAWAWEYLAGCFFSLSYVCGQDKSFKAIVFLLIAGACFTWIKNMWDRAK